MKELCMNCGKFSIISKETLDIIKDKAKKEVVDDVEDLLILFGDSWCSIIKDYDNHKCNGQDGADISFTKKDYEKLHSGFKKLKQKHK